MTPATPNRRLSSEDVASSEVSTPVEPSTEAGSETDTVKGCGEGKVTTEEENGKVKSKVEKLCQAFENGAELVDLTDIHPNVIANVVKLYMRQLPEPLMTFRLYNDFIRLGRSCPGPGPGPGSDTDLEYEREAVAGLQQLAGQLPRYHYNTLGFLCQHLARVAQHSDINNMPASNLAIGESDLNALSVFIMF